jgi:hypothetical protein
MWDRAGRLTSSVRAPVRVRAYRRGSFGRLLDYKFDEAKKFANATFNPKQEELVRERDYELTKASRHATARGTSSAGEWPTKQREFMQKRYTRVCTQEPTRFKTLADAKSRQQHSSSRAEWLRKMLCDLLKLFNRETPGRAGLVWTHL